MKTLDILASILYILGALVFIIGFLVGVFCLVFGFWFVAELSIKVITVAGILWVIGGVWLYFSGFGRRC